MTTGDKLVVLDVGSRGGLHSRWDRVADRLQVVAVDADADAQQPSAKYPVDVRRVGLSGTVGKSTLYLTRKAACSSLLRPNRAILDEFPDASRFDVVREVPVETLSLATLGVAPHFVKLDVQGIELDILKGAGTVLDGVIGVEAETSFVELWKDQPLFPELHVFMSAAGFVLADLSRWYWRRNDGAWRLVYADALYLRDRTTIDASRHWALDVIETAYGYRGPRRFVRGAQRLSRWIGRFAHNGPYHADEGLGIP